VHETSSKTYQLFGTRHQKATRKNKKNWAKKKGAERKGNGGVRASSFSKKENFLKHGERTPVVVADKRKTLLVNVRRNRNKREKKKKNHEKNNKNENNTSLGKKAVWRIRAACGLPGKKPEGERKRRVLVAAKIVSRWDSKRGTKPRRKEGEAKTKVLQKRGGKGAKQPSGSGGGKGDLPNEFYRDSESPGESRVESNEGLEDGGEKSPWRRIFDFIP